MTARLVATLLVLAFAALAFADGPGSGPAPPPSIHQRQLAAWNAREAAGWRPAKDAVTPPDRPLVPRSPALAREVHGFHPYWMGTAYASYEWSLLSTVAFFSLELDGTGQITNDHGWPWTTLVGWADAHLVRMIVTVTLFDAGELDALLSSPANRASAVANVVAEVVAGGADGVCVDFEGVPGARKADLVAFLGEMQVALSSAVAEPYLTIATPAVDWNNAFDYDELAARCNHLMVMTYDYHWPGSPTTGPVSPIAGWGTYNLQWTVNDYQTWGATPDQMLLGVPYYGYEWGAVSSEPGAATTSTGLALTYAQAAPEAAIHGTQWDEPSSSPWYSHQDPGWFQTWFDDAQSLAAKYDFVDDEGLAGAGIWALGYDGGLPELWDALGDAFAVTDVPVVEPGTVLRLSHAGANPFRDGTRLRWEAARPGAIRLSVYDVAGRRVRSLLEGATERRGIVPWDGRDAYGRPVPAGVYWARLETAGSTRALSLIRLR